IAERGSFPLEYPLAAAIVGLSGLIGRRIGIRPKRHDNWLVVPNLWGAIVGPPGALKTPAIREAMQPLRRLEALASKKFEEQLATFAGSQAIAKAKKIVAEQKLKAMASEEDADADELDALGMTIANLEASALAPQPGRYLTNDATVEKVGEILRANPFGITQY